MESSGEPSNHPNLPPSGRKTHHNAASSTPESKSRLSEPKPLKDAKGSIQVYRAADGRLYNIGQPVYDAPRSKAESSSIEPNRRTYEPCESPTYSHGSIEMCRAIDGRLWSTQMETDTGHFTFGLIEEGDEIEQLRRSPKMSGALPGEDDNGAGDRLSDRGRSDSPGAIECVRDASGTVDSSCESEQTTAKEKLTAQMRTLKKTNDCEAQITQIFL